MMSYFTIVLRSLSELFSGAYSTFFKSGGRQDEQNLRLLRLNTYKYAVYMWQKGACDSHVPFPLPRIHRWGYDVQLEVLHELNTYL